MYPGAPYVLSLRVAIALNHGRRSTLGVLVTDEANRGAELANIKEEVVPGVGKDAFKEVKVRAS